MSDDDQEKRGGRNGSRPAANDAKRGAGRNAAPRDGKGRGAGGERDRATGAEKKPFTPKSRGMKSHGGARDGEEPRPPKSYGTRSNDRPRAQGDERSFRPKPAGEKPRGEGRDWDKSGDRRGKPAGEKPRGERPERGGADGKRPFKPREERGANSNQRSGPRTDRTGDRSRASGDDQRGSKGPARRPVEDAASAQNADMRIARRLARAGIASRRDAEAMIADGRVKVNGKVIDSPALDVQPSDRIEVDNAPLPASERTRLWLFHKPAGTVTTNKDPEGRTTIFDRLPDDMPRVLSIGRLDINTEGLLLLTNDGGLSRVLELPSTGWLRRYRVRAHGTITQAQLDELRNGMSVDGVFYGAIEATLDRTQGSNVWITLGLREGKNREVKNVLGALGLDVNRLIRLSFGPFQLGDLDEGAVREVKGRTLRDQLGDRLIAESGADFDGPIAQPFSNKSVEGRSERETEKKSEWISAGEPINRKKFGEKKRDDALGRLDTKPRGKFADKPGGDRGDRKSAGPKREFGNDRGKPTGKFGKDDRGPRGKGSDDRPDANAEGPGRRRSNVWMAPNSKPWRDKETPDGPGEGRGKRDLTDPKRRVSRPPKPSGKGGKPSGFSTRGGGKPATGSDAKPARTGGSPASKPARSNGPRREGTLSRPKDRKPSGKDES